MKEIFFGIKGSNYGYDGVLIYKTDENWNDETIASFEEIILKKITKNYAIFYFPILNQYLKFNGETFYEDFKEIKTNKFNKISFKIIKEHDDEYSKKLDVFLPQIRFIIDGIDVINNLNKNSFYYGISEANFSENFNYLYEGRFLIGLCGCSCEGCDDIIATIGNYNNEIYWDVHSETGGGPNNNSHKYFVFNKNDYELIMEEIRNELLKWN